jgi:Spy/CpxP family protein refolding chaperone
MQLILRGGQFFLISMLFFLLAGQVVADELSMQESRAKQSMLQLENSLGQLGLSSEQKKSIDEVISKNQRAMRAPYNKMLEAKKTLEKSGYVENYNHQVVTQMAEQMAKAIEELQILQVTMQQQIFTQLTAQQKQQLLSVKKSNQKRSYQ